MSEKTVGLFGTCGDSRWREDVAIPLLEKANVSYFNPVVKDWNEEAMKNEAHHAANDQVIMLVITGETTAIASMAESGWVALQCVLTGRSLIVVLEDMPTEDPALRINKVRNLLRQHISKLPERLISDAASSVKVFDSVEKGTQAAIDALQN